MDNKLLMDDRDRQSIMEQEHETEVTNEPEGGEKPKKSIRERAIDAMEQEYQAKITQLEAETQKKKDALEQQSLGRTKEIEALTKRDQARAEMESFLTQKDEEISAKRFSLGSIYRNHQNAITRRSRLMKAQESYKKRQGKLEADVMEDIQAIELITEKINFINNEEPENIWGIHCAEEEKDEKQKDLEEKSQELADIQSKIKETDKTINDINTEIQNYEEEHTKIRLEYERQKVEQETNKAAFAQMQKQHKKEEPKWYKGYLKAREEYAKTSNDLSDAVKSKAEARDYVNNMELVQIQGEDGSVSEALYNASGEGRGFVEDDSAKKQLAVIREEAKVESQLKSAEIFQEINQNTIPTFLNYNPDTGNQYEEGEEKKNSNLLVNDINKLMSDENIKSIKELAVSLKGNDVIRSIDSLLTKYLFCSYPLYHLLELIENGNFKEIRSFVLSVISVCTSPQFRHAYPIVYEISNMIFSTLGDGLNIGDKGDLSVGTGVDAAVGNFGYAHFGEIVGKVLSTISGLVNWKDILAFAGKQGLKFAVENNRVTKTASHIIDSGKSFIGVFEEAAKGSDLSDEEEKMRAQGNEKYARILSGAKSAAYSQSVQNIINTGSNATKGFFTFSLGSFAGGAVNFGIGLAAKAINKVINWGFGKAEKSAVLNSPAVFGNVKYNEDLVGEEKFNEILKRVSGITSKDKVYGAIKTVDAISLHAAMRKSYVKPDHTADRVLADLGFENRALYPEISVYDIMKKSGHEPAGGDWRQELKDALLVEGKDYQTLMGAIYEKSGLKKSWEATKSGLSKGWEATKSGLGKGWNFVKSTTKSALSWFGKKLDSYWENKSKKQSRIRAVMA